MRPGERDETPYIRYAERTGRSIEIHDDVVVKTAPLDSIRREALKTELAYELGQASGLFRAPRVVRLEEHEGRLILERIEGVDGIGPIEARLARCADLPERLGAALAAIHHGLSLPAEHQAPVPPGYLWASMENVAIHGDFNGTNVMVRTSSKELVIVDWSTSARLGPSATMAPGWLDLVWFIRAQYHRLGFGGIPAGVAPACSRLVRAYLSADGKGSVGEFGRYLTQVIAEDRKRRNVCFTLRRRVAAFRGDAALAQYARRLAKEKE
ncbi:MAG: hypothetical protein HUU17_04750 [Chthonomonadales bacterium]|nr:hypothetical protein [Chthonomonadales bacterium]